MANNLTEEVDLSKSYKKLIISIVLLLIVNIAFTPLVNRAISFSVSLNFFLVGLNIIGFIIGFIVALVPYKKLTYRKKYLLASLFSFVGLNIIIASCIFSLFIFTKLGWYNREYTNAVQKPLSDTLLVYDDDGRIRAKGIMINKHKEGNWKEWNEKGDIESDMNYKNGLADGHAVVFYPNGNKQMEGTYIKQKADGFFTIWYSNGNKKNEGVIKQDKKIGIWKTWFEDGSLGADVNFDTLEQK